MNKLVAQRLQEKAEQFVTNFSRYDREFNFNQETFTIDKVVPLSETTAVVIANKNTGKKALGFFYCLKPNSDPEWRYFIPTESHIYGMTKLARVLHQVEQHNYPKNFSSEMERIEDAVEEMFGQN